MDSTVIIGQPYDFVRDEVGSANTQLDVTVAAPDADKQHVVQFITFSASAAPAAAVRVQLIEDLAGTPVELTSWQVPASALQPVNISLKGIKISAGKSVTLRIPALGAGVIASGTLAGMTRFR